MIRGSIQLLRRVLGVALMLGCTSALAAEPAACPSEPVRVVRSRGGVIDYHGSHAGLPELCRITRDGQEGEYYFSVWRSDWPGAGEAYPVIRAVVLGDPGAQDSFMTRSIPGMQWIDTYTNQGVEPLTIGDRTFDTLRTAHERRGIEGNSYHSVITSWRDIRTGITLRVHENQISGQSYGPDTTWTAVSVQPLAGGEVADRHSRGGQPIAAQDE